MTQKTNNPKSSKEAKMLIEEAVEIGDFELADKYYQDLKDLQNFEDEMELGAHVAEYFDENQLLSKQIDSSHQKFANDITEKIDKTNEIYKIKLEELQQKQENEIRDLYEKWKQNRENTFQSALKDYQQSMVTARLVAGQCNFKEAAAIKNKSMRLRQSNSNRTNSKNDEHFSNYLKLMEKRHKIEINKLIQMRNNEIHTLKLMLGEAPTQAGECFQIENAQNVVNVAKDFKTSRRVPLALQMQTIHGIRCDPNQIDANFPRNKNMFTKRMAQIDQTLTSPVPLSEKKPKKKKAGQMSTLRDKSKLY